MLALLVAIALPELAAAVAAVLGGGSPDVALGLILGSCILDVVLLGVAETWRREPSLYQSIDRRQILGGIIGVALLAFVLAALMSPAPEGDPSTPAAVTPLLLMVGAFIALRRTRVAGAPLPHLAVVAVAVVAAVAGALVVSRAGTNELFAATVLLPVVCVLPEWVVVRAAARAGNWDRAVAVPFLACIANLVALAVVDLAQRARGGPPLLAHVSPIHAMTVLSAIAVTLVAMLAIGVRLSSRPLRVVTLAAVAYVAFAAVNAWMLWRYAATP